MRLIPTYIIACVLFAASLEAATCSDYDILPPSVPQKLSFKNSELPDSYTLLEHEQMLEDMGMKTNPDYVSNLSEMESMAQRGGLASFLAIYGANHEPRLLLNGIYFRDTKRFEQFVEFQRSKRRLLLAFKLECKHGLWLLLVARDADLTYSDEEKLSIQSAIDKYRKRLKLSELFNDLW